MLWILVHPLILEYCRKYQILIHTPALRLVLRATAGYQLLSKDLGLYLAK